MPLNSLPSEQDLFKQIMLTNEIVWRNIITKQDIEKWLTNFRGFYFRPSYEKHLALFLLANFVYYNDNEVRHLCKLLFWDFLHWKLGAFSAGNIEKSLQTIIQKSMFMILGRPSESSSLISYYFRTANNIRVNLFSPDLAKIPSDVDTLIFIDDAIITGDQVRLYLKKELSRLIKVKNVVLLALITTEQAISDFNAAGVKIISSITLDNRSKCFSRESSIFWGQREHKAKCKRLAEGYGRKIEPSKPLGYQDGEYCFGFHYNIPDNTLPIFWSDKNGWVPILKRYEKKYVGEPHGELGTYV